jgi:hypothetical protein
LKSRPEYLSNTEAKQNDNSMLSLDFNRLNENPFYPQKKWNLRENQKILKTETKINHHCEIAEEEDISGESEWQLESG